MAQDTQPEYEAPEELEASAEGEMEEERQLTPEERIAELEAKCAELEEQHLRSRADYVNLRRRQFQDIEAAVQRQLQPLLEELLFVLDFLDMALASPAESDDAKNLAQGVQMTRAKFAQALESSEVREISTDGVFDPSLHDARDTRVAPGAPVGTILEVVRRGYTFRDKVLRPAQVVVAAAEAAEDAEERDDREG